MGRYSKWSDIQFITMISFWLCLEGQIKSSLGIQRKKEKSIPG